MSPIATKGVQNSGLHDARREQKGRAFSLCPDASDINLFGYGEGIIDFDAEIPHRALDLCVPEE
jgi:hypothetical protein